MANNKNIRKSKNDCDGNLENFGSINSVMFGTIGVSICGWVLFFIAVKIITLLEIFTEMKYFFVDPRGIGPLICPKAFGPRYQFIFPCLLINNIPLKTIFSITFLFFNCFNLYSICLANFIVSNS